MVCDRFFVDSMFGNEVTLEGQEFHHLAHVVRIKEGEEIEIVNGRGDLATGVLTKLKRHQAEICIQNIVHEQEKLFKILLGVPLLRMSKLEWIVEKGTELGAFGFHLFPAEQSEKISLSNHQLERLCYLATSALKQCGRLYLPEISLYPSMEELLKTPRKLFFGDTRKNASTTIHLEEKDTSILFVSGPEKGFSSGETKLLHERGSGICLSSNILRAETAPLCALSILEFISLDLKNQ